MKSHITFRASFFLATALLLGGSGSVLADGEKPSTPPAAQGLIPVPDYTGDLWHRNRLTGDWGGTRTDLANMCIQLEVNFTQTMQSVVSGGSDNPAVGSDLVLLLRYRLRPGAEHGRPLDVDETGMWVVTDDYPGKAWKPPTTSGYP